MTTARRAGRTPPGLTWGWRVRKDECPAEGGGSAGLAGPRCARSGDPGAALSGELIYPRSLGFPLGGFGGCGKAGTGNVLTQPGPVDGFTVETCFIEFLLNWGTAPAELGD